MPAVDDKNFSPATVDQPEDIDTVAGYPEQGGSAASARSTTDFSESRFVSAQAPDAADEWVTLPWLGNRRITAHQRILAVVMAVALLVLAVGAAWALHRADTVAQQLAATGQALMQSQRLAKSMSQALVGNTAAFADVAESADVLAKNVRGLQAGDDRLKPVNADAQTDIAQITPLMERAEKNAATVMGQQKILTQVGAALHTINRQSSDLLEIAETIASFKLQQAASPSEISAAGQLVMLTQRIGKSANEFQTLDGVSPEAVFLLGKDLNAFKEITQGLLDGSPELRLGAAKDAATREQLNALRKVYDETRTQAGAILGNLQGLVSAREAQNAVLADSEPLRRQLEVLQDKLSSQTGLGLVASLVLVLSTLLALACAAGLAAVQLRGSRKRQTTAEMQRLHAESSQQGTKRVNDANQAAILRLMNELQAVAEGDLTQQATVTEDITGANDDRP